MAAILVFFCFLVLFLRQGAKKYVEGKVRLIAGHLLPCKLALMASFKVKYSFEFYVWKRGHKGKFAWKQKNPKMAAIFE